MSIQFTKRYTALLNKAASIAEHERLNQIERRHLFLAICMMCPTMFNSLLKSKRLVYPEQLPQDTLLEEYNGVLSFSRDAYRVLTPYGGYLGEVMKLVGNCPVDIKHVAVALLLDADVHGPVGEMLLVNGIILNDMKTEVVEAVKGKASVRKAELAKEVLAKVSFVRKALQDKIVGQGKVIERICASLLEFWNRPPEERKRPLSIFITGAPGSGKTLLADTLMSAVSELTGKPIIATLNSGLFASVDSAHDLMGLDNNWKGGPREGFYTQPIVENPNGVICLDNIDTLHQVALNSVLNAITTGCLKDNSNGKKVDYRDAICLFISSAGGEYVSEATMSARSPQRKRLAEELCSGIANMNAERNVRFMVEQTSLPVVMKPLDVAGIRELLAKSIEREFNSMKSIFKRIVMDKDALADLLVQTIDSLDPRGIPSILDIVVGTVRDYIFNLPNAHRGVKELDVVIEGAGELNLQRVAENLHMRKRMTVSATVEIKDKKAILHVKAGDYVMLPAINDGIISVTPPLSLDTFDNLVGISAPLEYARRWKKYFAGEDVSRPDHLLLAGPPGCGKTSFVRALANDLQKPYVVLNCGDLGSPDAIIGAFTAIRRYARDGLLVFLDEIDSIGGDRRGKSEAYIERLDLFLQQIDGFRQDLSAKVVYIAATNRPSSLDSAILRPGRFGQSIVFSPLVKNELRTLVRLAAGEYKACIDKDLEDFIVETAKGLCPATVKAIIREMVFFSGDGKASKEQYLKARQAVVYGVFTQQTELSEEEEYSVACHEAGHALCSDLNNRGFVQASIVSRGDKLGFIEQSDADLSSRTKEGILVSIDIFLAGRAAQEILLEQTTDGAINDIERARDMAIHYIKSGFSEYGLWPPPEENEWDEVSPVVRKLLNDRYEHVKQQLSKEKAVLQALVDLLLKKKLVFQEELQVLRRNLSNEGSVNHA